MGLFSGTVDIKQLSLKIWVRVSTRLTSILNVDLEKNC
jgi:hypothetical protein